MSQVQANGSHRFSWIFYNPTTGAPYDPDPAPTVDLYLVPAGGVTPRVLVAADQAAEADILTGGYGFLVADVGATLGDLQALASTTDAALTPYPEYAERWDTVQIAAAVEVNPTTIAQAVWDTLTSALTTSGSIGKWLLDNIGTLLSRTAGGSITVTAPVLSSGDVEIVRGDDYLAADGRALEWTSDDWTPLDLTTAEAILFKAKTRYSETVLSIEAEALSDTQVRVELTHDDTDGLAVGRDAYRFDLEAEHADGRIVTLTLGKIHVVEDIR